MSIKKGTTAVTAVKYNNASNTNADTNQIIRDGVSVWCKPFSYTQGTLPTGVAALTCTRSETSEPTASTGTVASGGTIYYKDKLYWTATASTGYTVSVTHGSSSKVTVSGDINGVSSSGVSAARISGTLSQGSLPNGVASITCYRKPWNGDSYAVFSSGTIYYGDKFYWTATASTGYYSPTVTYGSTSNVYTWTGSQGGSITSVSASGLAAGARIKWSLAVTMNNYVASWTYKIGSNSAVSKTASYTIENLDYSDSVVIAATSQSEAAWDYGTISGTGTYSYNGSTSQSITLSNTRSRKSYTITFTEPDPDYVTWESGKSSTKTAYYGDIIKVSGTTVTCYKWDATTTARWTNSVSALATTAQYSYSTPTISPTADYTVTAAKTYSASSTRTLRSYTITFTNPTYGAWGSATKTAYYGDTLTVDGYKVTCAGTASWSNTCTASATTDQYTYALSGTITVTSPVTGAQTIAAPGSSRTERQYTVTFGNPSPSYGSWGSASKTAYYSDKLSLSGLTVTCKDSAETTTRWTNVYTGTADTAEWDYSASVSGTFPMTVGTGKTINSATSRTKKSYTVSIAKGTGISSVYLSTTNTATSGDVSGTSYNYGTTVYAFAVLAEHYDIPSGSSWTLVSGTANATGAKYRVGSVSVTGTHNFGTISAAIEKYTLSITKGTGVSTIYYKVNGASSYTSTTSNLSVSVNDLSTYYYYATVDSHYTANTDCGTSSSPKSGTVNCANVSTSVSATAKQYTLVGTYTNGWVKWYSDSARTTEITKAAYGATVYYTYGSNTGYTGSGNGSLVLNTTNFTFASTDANANATHSFGGSTRITWTLQITKSNYMATVTYSKNSATAVTVTDPVTLTLDYADSVVVSGTKQSEAPYNYGSITGAGTFTYSSPSTGNKTTTVACTRSVKSYTFTLTKNSNVSTIKIWRTSSPYQGAATSTESSPLINGSGTATVYYGDKISGSATAASGYHFGSSNTTNTDSYTNNGVTSTPSWGPSVNIDTCTITWKYLSAYPDTWATATETYNYGQTPSRTAPSNVTNSGSTERWASGTWGSISAIAADESSRTIQASYTKQFYITFTGTRCSCTSHSSGWYTNSSTAFTATWTASDNCSFGGLTAKDTTTQSITPNQSASYSKTATKIYVTIQAGSNNASVSPNAGSQFVIYNSSCIWTPATYYSYEAGTTQKSKTVNLTTPGGTYSYSPSYVRAESIATGSYNARVDKNASNYYAANTYPTWTADSNHSYNGSSAGDTKTGTVAITAGANISALTPGYTKITVTGTRCSIKVGSTARASGWSGLVANGTTITWTASSGYSFADGTSQTATTTENVAISKYSYSASADYKYITVSGTHCTGSPATGYRKIGNTITWTGESGTGYKYSFSNSPEKDPTDAQRQTTATISDSTSSYSKTASYIYYNATISTTTGYSANKSSGYFVSGTVITFTAPSNSDVKRYSFSTSSSESHTQTKTITSATSYSNDTAYVWMNCTCTGTHCSATNGWYRVGTNITWTGDSDGSTYKYGFQSNTTWSSSYATATSTVVEDTTAYTKTADYLYYNVTISPNVPANCTGTPSSGYIKNGTSITWNIVNPAFQTNCYYSFSTSDRTVQSKTSGTVSGAGTIYGPQMYVWVNIVSIQGTNCSTSVGTGWRYAGNKIPWTADTGYAFNSTGSTTTLEDCGTTGTISKTAGYAQWNITYTNCSFTSGTQNGWYTTGTTGKSTATANTNWSFGGSSTKDTKSTNNGSTHAVPYSETLSPGFCYITVNSGTGVSTAVSVAGTSRSTPWSGIAQNGAQISWTANTNYSFGSNHASASSATINGPATYTKSADYGYVTINRANNVSSVSPDYYSDWYEISTTSLSMTATAASGYAYATNGNNSKGFTVTNPGSVDVCPGYWSINIAPQEHVYVDYTEPTGLTTGVNWIPVGTSVVIIHYKTDTGYNANGNTSWAETVSQSNGAGTTQTGSSHGEATLITYAVSIATGTGVSSVYLSTSSTATSGDDSGTYYSHGTVVYGFAVLSEGYNAASSWTKVSGTANSTGAKYRVGSKTVTSSQNFGTQTAVRKTWTGTINIGSGVSEYGYYVNNANNGSTYGSVSSGDYITINSLDYSDTVVYWVETASSGYNATSAGDHTSLTYSHQTDTLTAPVKTYTYLGWSSVRINNDSSYWAYTVTSVTLYDRTAGSTVAKNATIYATHQYAITAIPSTGSGGGNGNYNYIVVASPGSTTSESTWVRTFYPNSNVSIQVYAIYNGGGNYKTITYTPYATNVGNHYGGSTYYYTAGYTSTVNNVTLGSFKYGEGTIASVTFKGIHLDDGIGRIAYCNQKFMQYCVVGASSGKQITSVNVYYMTYSTARLRVTLPKDFCENVIVYWQYGSSSSCTGFTMF